MISNAVTSSVVIPNCAECCGLGTSVTMLRLGVYFGVVMVKTDTVDIHAPP